MQITPDDFVLAHFKRSAVAGAHVVSRMMTQYRCNRAFLILLLIGAEDFPQVAGGGIHRRAVLRFHLPSVVRKIVETAFWVFDDGGKGPVRGPRPPLVAP